MRTDDSFDLTYRDPTAYNLEDLNLWTEYETYTTKFELALYDNEGTAPESNVAYNSRAYGVLNSAWLGFSETLDLLWILNKEGRLMSSSSPIYVVEGLQSEEYFVATGINWPEAQNTPVLLD